MLHKFSKWEGLADLEKFAFYQSLNPIQWGYNEIPHPQDGPRELDKTNLKKNKNPCCVDCRLMNLKNLFNKFHFLHFLTISIAFSKEKNDWHLIVMGEDIFTCFHQFIWTM